MFCIVTHECDREYCEFTWLKERPCEHIMGLFQEGDNDLVEASSEEEAEDKFIQGAVTDFLPCTDDYSKCQHHDEYGKFSFK